MSDADRNPSYTLPANVPAVVNSNGASPGNVVTVYGTTAGPNPYSAGGFTIDLSAHLSSILAAKVWVQTVGGLPGAMLSATHSGGVVTVVVLGISVAILGLSTVAEIGSTNLSGTTFGYEVTGVAA